MIELSTAELNSRAKRGINLLMKRQVIVQILTFAGGVVLARVLGPAQLGLYIITSFFVGTFALLGDFGLSSSLIQRKAELTERDLQVGFTLQQILTTLIVTALIVLAPALVHLYPKAPAETVWLIRALAFNLYLTSWRTMSALQLERGLHFDKLARVEVVEALSYQSVAVIMALTGFGVWSYICATLLQGLLGTILIYRAAPWPIKFGFDRTIAHGILRYGIPFQLQAISNSAGGWATPLLVGPLIGPVGIGYLTWASANGKKPLLLVDNVMRVAFPHFARIQHDKGEVERLLTRYLTYLLLAVGFWFSVLVTAGPALVQWIYTDKWMPAVFALILSAGVLSFDVTSWVLGVTLNSLGRVTLTTRIVLARTVLNVLLSIILTPIYGFIGVPIAFLISSLLTVPWLFFGYGREAAGRIILELAWIITPVAASILCGHLALHLNVPFVLRVIAVIVTSITSFLVTMWVTAPRELRLGWGRKMRQRTRFPAVSPSQL